MKSSTASGLIKMICPLCRSTEQSVAFKARDYEYEVPGEWTIAHCAACGLYYQDPLPAFSELNAFYPSTYSAYNTDSPGAGIMSLLHRLVYWLDTRRMSRLAGPTDRILDIGCGDGAALMKMKQSKQWDLC